MTRPTSGPLLLATAALAIFGLIQPASAAPRYNTITVKEGQSIQNAINSANSGDRIVVLGGKYKEQLEITKDGISLEGRGAILSPPDLLSNNFCTGLANSSIPGDPTSPPTQAGICVHGVGVTLADFVAEHRKVLTAPTPVRDVSITGFTIHDFDLNIAVIGAKDACVTQNSLTDGNFYGVLSAGSENSNIQDNTLVSNDAEFLRFIAICMDDKAGSSVVGNRISGYNIALCVQTNGGRVQGNRVRKTCIGAFVDPGVDGALVQGNQIQDTNPACGPDTPFAFAAWGIVISGATNTVVQGNLITGITDGGNQNRVAAGIQGFDGVLGATAVGGNNVVRGNVLFKNDVDLVIQSTGTGNVVKGNKCKSSTPAGYCS